MNTLKAKIIVFFLLTTFLIFTALTILILKMEREDRIQDLTGLLHHISSEIISDHLHNATPSTDLQYLKRIELIQTLSADKALSNPFFKIIPSSAPKNTPNNTIMVVTKLSNGYYFIARSDTLIIDKNIQRLTMTLYILFFGALSLLTLVFYIILKKLLDPMEQLARSCVAIDLEGGPTHFPVSSASVEIQRLGSALQSLVDKIAFLREKERQMFKDTAHQFKTPLAILKARLDRYALDPKADKELFLRQANGDIAKLLKYLKELLIVQESMVPQDEPSVVIDVESLIEGLSAYAAPLLMRKHQSVDLTRGDTFSLTTHIGSFKKLILTILENCINHAPENSTITIVLDSQERRIVFGNSVSADKTPALFNSNLGLNIIRELSVLLNMDVTIERTGEKFLLSLNCIRS